MKSVRESQEEKEHYQKNPASKLRKRERDKERKKEGQKRDGGFSLDSEFFRERWK